MISDLASHVITIMAPHFIERDRQTEKKERGEKERREMDKQRNEQRQVEIFKA